MLPMGWIGIEGGQAAGTAAVDAKMAKAQGCGRLERPAIPPPALLKPATTIVAIPWPDARPL